MEKTEKCAFKNCKKGSDDFFYSPTDPALLKKWQEVVKTKSEDFAVCIEHFRRQDIIYEKTLDEGAIPVGNINELGDLKVNVQCCGSCLRELKDGTTAPTKETTHNFYEITNFSLVTDFMCLQCSFFLKSFTRFKTEIKEKHKKIREQKNNEKKNANFKPHPAKKPSKIPIIPISSFPLVQTKILRICRFCSFKTYDKDSLIGHLKDMHGESSGMKAIQEPNKKSHFSDHRSPTIRQDDKKKTKFVVHTPRSFAKLNLEHSRKRLLSKLENTIKTRIFPPSNAPKPSPYAPKLIPVEKAVQVIQKPPVLQKPIPIIHEFDPVMPSTSSIPSSTVSASGRPLRKAAIRSNLNKNIDYEEEEEDDDESNDQYEVFEVQEIEVKEEEEEDPEEIKKEIETEMSTIEIKNIDDILKSSIEGNKNRRKQNIVEEQLEPDMVFKEEPVEQEVVANIDIESSELESSDESDSDESEESNDDAPLNYIPPPKKTYTKNSDTIFKNEVTCLDCNESMDIDELYFHRELMHSNSDKLNYDDIRNSNLPPSPPRPPRKPKTTRATAKIPCAFCAKMIAEYRMQLHVDHFHSDKPHPFLCHVCSRSFSQNVMLKYHMAYHDPSLQFHCDICGKSFITKSRINKHIRRAHLNIFVPRSICPICNQKIYKGSRNYSHMDKYHPNGLDEGHRVNPITNYFDCSKCGASYADLYTFKRHDCSKGRFQMRCPDCNKPVKNEEYLQKHLKYKCIRLNKYSTLNSANVNVK